MASLLPTGETTFFDANGVPLAGGSATFYIPGTTTPKDTWQNSAQTILNANPVTLDSAGRAIIYGSGSYRQIVKDQLGNIVWDQETAEPNSGAVSFGGTSGGTANAQTLSASQFSYMDGQIISFVAGISNTGAMTFAVGGGSPIAVLKNGVSGPVALVAGDIVAGNSYFIQYSAQLSSFQLLLSVAPPTPLGPFLRGYLWGLTLANNSGDATNSIDIGVGAAGSDGATPVLMNLASGLTKIANAPWAVGNGGWLDTGTIADGTYFPYLIQRSDTGVVDSVLSLSPSAPTMPANYDRKRRIGIIIRTAGSIVQFIQNGDKFRLKARPICINAAAVTPSTSTLTLIEGTVPTGISLEVELSLSIAANGIIALASLNALDETDSIPTSAGGDVGASASTSTFTQAYGYDLIRMNASRQIRATSFATASVSMSARVKSWTDDRGRTS